MVGASPGLLLTYVMQRQSARKPKEDIPITGRIQNNVHEVELAQTEAQKETMQMPQRQPPTLIDDSRFRRPSRADTADGIGERVWVKMYCLVTMPGPARVIGKRFGRAWVGAFANLQRAGPCGGRPRFRLSFAYSRHKTAMPSDARGWRSIWGPFERGFVAAMDVGR